jgi:hypothetical protein
MSWSAKVQILDPDRVQRISVACTGNEPAGELLSHRDVIEGWRSDADFRKFYNATIAASPFSALFWELPPLTAESVERRHECVVVRSTQLAGVRSEPGAFAEYFKQPGQLATSFGNLGGDAVLVAPAPGAGLQDVAHLASFARSNDVKRQDTFWQSVGCAMHQALSAQPRWLSTSGLGIYWLHARIDTRPKYYTHAPYRDPGFYSSAEGQP